MTNEAVSVAGIDIKWPPYFTKSDIAVDSMSTFNKNIAFGFK